MELSVSVVIPTFNRRWSLEYTLISLQQQNKERISDLHIIVVDHGSTDDTGEMIASFRAASGIHMTYKRIDRTEPVCLAAVRNVGAQISNEDVVLFLDSDMVLMPSFLNALAQLWSSSVVPEKLVVVPRILGIYLKERGVNVSQFAIERESIPSVIEKFGADIAWQDPREELMCMVDDNLNSLSAPWTLGWTGALAVSRSLFTAVNGFNEELVDWGSEDTELCYRMYLNGATFRALPGNLVLQLPQSSVLFPSPEVRREGTVKNRERLRRAHDRFDAELFVYYPGRLYSYALSKWNALAPSIIVPFYSGHLLQLLNEQLVSAEVNIAIGFDRMLFLRFLEVTDIFVHNERVRAYLEHSLTPKRVHYKLGCCLAYEDHEVGTIIMSDFIRVFPDTVLKDLLRETTRVARRVIFLYTKNYTPSIFTIEGQQWASFDHLQSLATSEGLRLNWVGEIDGDTALVDVCLSDT